MKTKIAIVGSGNIGWALKQLLEEDYEIKQGDITDGFDATDISQVKEFLTGVDAVISAGPFAVNKNIAQVASEESIGYFDLTEDVETTDFVKSLKSNNIIMPQCGLAPGAINICAAGMMKHFDNIMKLIPYKMLHKICIFPFCKFAKKIWGQFWIGFHRSEI